MMPTPSITTVLPNRRRCGKRCHTAFAWLCSMRGKPRPSESIRSSAISETCGPCTPRPEVTTTSFRSDCSPIKPSVPVVKAWIHFSRAALRSISSLKMRVVAMPNMASTSFTSSPTSALVGRESKYQLGEFPPQLGAVVLRVGVVDDKNGARHADSLYERRSFPANRSR